ncbi:MAG: DUF5916 domain-containing protein [Tunicatimonas sp.]
MKLLLVFCVLSSVGLLTFPPLLAQNAFPPEVRIQRASSPITLDGVADEPAWLEADVAGDYWQTFPMDTSLATAKTEFRMTYDDKFIYIAAVCYKTAEEDYFVTPSLRRDFRGGSIDLLTFLIDPFQDGTTAFLFGINPFGVQREGLISNGGANSEDFDLSWDNKWYSAVKVYDDYWLAELAIPFKTLRFKEGSTTWNLNTFRQDSYINERSVWSRIPRNFMPFSLAFPGKLRWDAPLRKPGANVSLIPYVAGNVSRNHLEGTETNAGFNAGGDAKIAVTPSLNLDLTINPDFSQVEVDRQVTNIDRFEIFFPERRQFFLENADLFGSFGSERARPFFSRRIGVAIDSDPGVNVQNQILGGARLSGRVNKQWRVGLMNMQTGRDAQINQPSVNYSVAAVQRQVFARSNIAALFVNKQAMATGEFGIRPNAFNRLAGLDYNLASANSKWTGKAYYHRSFDPDRPKDTYSHGVNLLYSTPNWDVSWEHQLTGRNFNAEVGFVPRTGIRRAALMAQRTFYPRSAAVNRHGPGVRQQVQWNPEAGVTDHSTSLFYEVRFLNTSNLMASLEQTYVQLLRGFNPTGRGESFGTGDEFLARGLSLAYRSDGRRLFSYEFETYHGEYYGGYLHSFGGEFNYRWQPYGLITLNLNYNRIRLPEPYATANLWLIGPRLDLTFTRSLFFTTFVQYNNQSDNLNINSRLQWRFQPVSDLFIVYTDNYFPELLKVKNRSLVLKLSYWLNL